MKQLFKNRSRLLLLLAVLLLAVAALAGTGYARYRSQVAVTGQLSYSSRLASKFQLREYVMTENADGSYSKGAETSVKQQEYRLIPGMTIPQEPFLILEGKSSVPAVLYLEVCSLEGVSFELSSDWTLLEGLRGPKGGEIYVYRSGSALEAQEPGMERIGILKEGFLVERSAETEGTVQMVGYLLQCTEDYTPKMAGELFQNRLKSNG